MKRHALQLGFFGATGTVTGSRYVLKGREGSLLVDCGMFQGVKALRLRNWQAFPFDPAAIGAAVLTHAHLDHSGMLPVLARGGFAGPVYCSPGTRELCAILLRDAAYLQEEQARYANQHSFSKHHPALPLYTQEDAERALALLEPLALGQRVQARGFSIELVPAGHILGASIVAVEAGGRRIVFSGDLGRPADPVMRPPAPIAAADYLVVESTYGDRSHAPGDPEQELASHLRRALGRGGVVVIPAFAVGRAQTLLHYLARLRSAREIPPVPIYLNSPMAQDATRLYRAFTAEHRLSAEEAAAACEVATFVRTAEESRALNERREPMIIVSASGMATGGRVLHHIAAFAPEPRNLLLFTGFQAAGTRGATIVAGAPEVKIHGRYVPIRAEVVKMDSLSAHADAGEILAWLRGFRAAPKRTFITHGEPAAADGLRRRIAETLRWECEVPDYRDSATLE